MSNQSDPNIIGKLIFCPFTWSQADYCTLFLARENGQIAVDLGLSAGWWKHKNGCMNLFIVCEGNVLSEWVLHHCKGCVLHFHMSPSSLFHDVPGPRKQGLNRCRFRPFCWMVKAQKWLYEFLYCSLRQSPTRLSLTSL